MALRCVPLSIILTFACLAGAPSASGAIFMWDYLKNYKAGIENGFTRDIAVVSYDVSASTYNDPRFCTTMGAGPNKTRCSARVPADSQSGLSLFLQQAFKRKGFWHYDFDLGMSFRSLHEDFKRGASDGPLQEVKFDLYGIFLKPHLTFGITPQAIFPDFLLSCGPTAQIYEGTTTINHTGHNTGLRGVWHRSDVLNLLSYTEAELVVWRFAKNGALSLFIANEQDTAQNFDGDIAPEAVGNMTNVGVTFDRRSSGIKLLLSWP